MAFGRYFAAMCNIGVIFTKLAYENKNKGLNIRNFALAFGVYGAYMLDIIIFQKLLTYINSANNIIWAEAFGSLIVIGFVFGIECLKDDEEFCFGYEILVMPILVVALSAYIKFLNLGSLSVISTLVAGFLMCAIFFRLYVKSLKEASLKIEKELFILQNRAFENQLILLKDAQDKLSYVRHDLKNHLFAINSFIQNDQKDKAISYIEQATKQISEPNIYSKTADYLFDSIINYKLSQVRDKGLNISLNINIPTIIDIYDLDKVSIVGNLLDNAIEEAINSYDKNLSISIYNKQGFVTMEIANSYNDSYIKGGKHKGIGLKSVNNSINRYNGLLEIDKDENMYEVRCSFYEQ